MDNSKQNPNPNILPPPEGDKEEEVRSIDDEEEDSEEDHPSESQPSESRSRPSRRPFTSLSQIDADLALARTLQEQERAYMMLRMGGAEAVDYSDEGSEYELEYEDGAEVNHGHPEGENGSVEESDYDEGDEEEFDDDVDAFDAQEDHVEIDPSAFADDEAFARALQEAEEREVAIRLMALTGIHDWVTEEREDHRSTSQDTWQDVDPDDFSYEELVALGEAVGTESRGLSANAIASLPSVSYTNKAGQEDNNDQCVICRLDYEDGDTLSILPCKHMYHNECINKWLQINKVCPVCSVEVSGPSASKA